MGYLESSKIVENPLYSSDLSNADEPLEYSENKYNALEDRLYKPSNQIIPGSLEGIFADKAKTQKASAKAFLDEIKLRETLNSRMLYNIDNEILKQNNQILGLDNRKEGYFFENFIDLKKLKLKIEDRVLEMEREKRKEYIECWRDLMVMKKYLLSSLKDYWNIARKRDALSLDFTSLNHNEIQTGYQGTLQPIKTDNW